MKKEKITIKKIWNAIKAGKTVCWQNESYEVHPVESDQNKYSSLSFKDGKALRITCVENYFGSLIEKNELSHCFILDKSPQLK